MPIRLVLAVVVCLATFSLDSQAQDPNLMLSASSAGGIVGSQEDVTILLDSSASQAFTGWSVAVCHDPAAVTLEDATIGGSVLALDPSFSQTSFYPTGFSSAVVTDFLGATALEPGPAHELNIATYTLVQEGLAEITLCDDVLGSPAVSISFGTTSILPTLVHGTIDVGTVPNLVLGIDDFVGAPSDCVEALVELDSLIDIDGFAIGVAHDDNIATLQSIVFGDVVHALNDGDGPDYSFVNVSPVGGSGGTCAALFSLSSPFEQLPAGDGVVLARFEYQVSAGASPASDTPLTFSHDLGAPPLASVITVAGETRIPVFEPGSITVDGDVIPTGAFRRGDFNTDGLIDLSDAVGLLTFLFAGGTAPTCDDSADTNDDGAIGIDDAVSVLSFSFSGGVAPPVPFDACGADPTEDALGCATFGGCP